MFKALGETTVRERGEHAALILGLFPGHLGEIDKKTEAQREEGFCHEGGAHVCTMPGSPTPRARPGKTR